MKKLHAISVAHHKNTAYSPARRMEVPKQVLIPMSMNIGAPAEPVVKVTEKEGMRTDLWTTTAIRNEELGEFYHDTVHRSVDWRHPYGEEISLPPDVWQRLWEELPGILRAIGVK